MGLDFAKLAFRVLQTFAFLLGVGIIGSHIGLPLWQSALAVYLIWMAIAIDRPLNQTDAEDKELDAKTSGTRTNLKSLLLFLPVEVMVVLLSVALNVLRGWVVTWTEKIAPDVSQALGSIEIGSGTILFGSVILSALIASRLAVIWERARVRRLESDA